MSHKAKQMAQRQQRDKSWAHLSIKAPCRATYNGRRAEIACDVKEVDMAMLAALEPES